MRNQSKAWLTVLLLCCFVLAETAFAQIGGGRALHGGDGAKSRVAKVSIYTWLKKRQNAAKKTATAVLVEKTGNEPNSFQKRKILNYERRLMSRMPSFVTNLSMGNYYPAQSKGVIRWRPENMGKIISSNGKPKSLIRIVRVMPNPKGDDRDNEKVELENISRDTIDLKGWTLEDIAGNSYQLSGAIPKSTKRMITIKGSKLLMNNTGREEVSIKGPTTRIHDTLIYDKSAQDDEWILHQ